MGLVYKRKDCKREWNTKEWILDGGDIQKHRFLMGVVYKRMDFKWEWYTKGQILQESGIQKGGF